MHQPCSIPTERKRKMVPCTDKYDKVGKKRSRKIHSRVNYLAEECGFTDKPSYKKHPLCSCCARKLKYHDRSEVDVNHQTLGVYIRCSGFSWYVEPETNSLVAGE